jgi:MFS family permease
MIGDYARVCSRAAAMTSTTTPVSAPAGSWDPLRRPRFRSVWTALLGSQLVVWSHNVGAVTVVASLSDSPTLIALVQTATSLPAVALSLLAGATADIVDRRRLVLAAQAWMTAATAVLAALTLGDVVSPAAVLLLTLALGGGMTITIVAYQAMTPDAVERGELPQAVALNSVAINLARATGPALAGLVIVALSAGALFAIESACVVGLMLVVARLRLPRPPGGERESLPSALRAGARYIRFFRPARSVLARAGVFSLCASALWALMPVVAVGPLDLDSRGLGVLMACIGGGALAAAAVLPRVRPRLDADLLIALATTGLAAGLAALAYVRVPVVVGLALVLSGASWLTVLSSLNTAAQRAAAGWVRARTLAGFQLVFQGTLALGSLGWGLLTGATDVRLALMVAVGGLLAGIVVARRWPLAPGEDLDLSPALHWSEPSLAFEPESRDGPVLVTLEYRIPKEHAGEFVEAMRELGRVRRRDGAYAWELYEDLEDPGLYLETFWVQSWQEHLRQHERLTVGDLELERRVKSMHTGDSPPVARHLLRAPAAASAISPGDPAPRRRSPRHRG